MTGQNNGGQTTPPTTIHDRNSTGLRIDGLQIDHTGRVGTGPLVRLSAVVRPGEVLTVMGASGSGKSTLLSGLIGALPPGFVMSGRVVVNGRDVSNASPQERRIGLLFQDDVLFAHLSVAQNLGFGLQSGGSRAARAARIEDALTRVGLRGFGPRDPATLSGGQRARVALMRTLLASPDALLLDEPFSRLDQTLRAQIRDLVFTEAAALPIILVTHDREDARAAGGMVVDTMGNRLSV